MVLWRLDEKSLLRSSFLVSCWQIRTLYNHKKQNGWSEGYRWKNVILSLIFIPFHIGKFVKQGKENNVLEGKFSTVGTLALYLFN
jgi:hypothetical protein